MTAVLQTVVSVVLAALIAGQLVITRTGRLRKIVHGNIDLLDKLPADHPSRATVETHIRELVDVLVWQERQQFHPLSPPRPPLRSIVFLVVATLLWGALFVAGLVGAYRPVLPSPTVLWFLVAVYAALTVATVVLIRSTVKLDRQQRRLLQRVASLADEPAPSPGDPAA